MFWIHILIILRPSPESGILLATYDFTLANKLFAFNLVSLRAEHKQQESPISSVLSFTSYLLHHAYRSSRASLYAYLDLFILRILVEDQLTCKHICDGENKIAVRLCRQRLPYLPLTSGDRILATVILDIMVDALNHNLRRRLDFQLYMYVSPIQDIRRVILQRDARLCLGILLRIVSFLSRSRTRLAYHWSELWRTLLALLRFLTTYASDFSNNTDTRPLLDSLVNLIVLSLSNGEAFLPDPAAYDDLFYKLVESGPTLTKFRDAYNLNNDSDTNSIATLINVSHHYQDLLDGEKSKGKKNLSPREVSNVIKKGYETLSIQSKDGLDRWEEFREADEKTVLKKIARVAVEDVKRLLRER